MELNTGYTYIDGSSTCENGSNNTDQEQHDDIIVIVAHHNDNNVIMHSCTDPEFPIGQK